MQAVRVKPCHDVAMSLPLNPARSTSTCAQLTEELWCEVKDFACMQYAQPMMPMAGRSFKQAHQGSGGRGGGAATAGAGPGAAVSSSSAPQVAAEGAGASASTAGAGRGGAGRGTAPSQELQKQGLTIHRAGPGGAPVRARPQSAVEPRSTTPPQEPFADEVQHPSPPLHSSPRALTDCCLHSVCCLMPINSLLLSVPERQKPRAHLTATSPPFSVCQESTCVVNQHAPYAGREGSHHSPFTAAICVSHQPPLGGSHAHA